MMTAIRFPSGCQPATTEMEAVREIIAAYPPNCPATVVLLDAEEALFELDPIAGFRPSADLLFASIARAGIPASGGLLAGEGKDGAKGLQALAAAGAQILTQRTDDSAANERFEAVRELALPVQEINAAGIARWILAATNREKLAA